MERASERCCGCWRGCACAQEVRAVPERAHIPDGHALRPRLLLALHCGLAQPEARVPALPLHLHYIGPCLRVPQRFLAGACALLMGSWGLHACEGRGMAR